MLEPARPQIRDMNRDDLVAAVRLQREVVSQPWTLSDFRDSLEAGHRCVLALWGGEIAACAVARLVLDEAELLTIATASHCRRRGIARALLQELVDGLTAAGARACFLEVMQGNIAAISLYRQLGFQRVGRRQAYYALPESRVDALVMRCSLNQAGSP
jgi:ribosomal-protein-alanine N-acetyltransferase